MQAYFTKDNRLHAENANLRRKLEKMENEGYIAEMKKKQDTELDKKDRNIASLDKGLAKYREWRNCDIRRIRELEFDNALKDVDISSLHDELATMKNENKKLEDCLQERDGIIQKFKAQINRDYQNSSIPSSQSPNHKKICNGRQKSSRKPGGQPGHKGHGRQIFEPNAAIVLPDPLETINNPDYRETGEIIRKQVIDMQVQVKVTEYQAKEFKNIKTGKTIHTAFPSGVVNESSFGSGTKALACMLGGYCNVSIDKVQEVLYEITGNRLKISKGTLSNLMREFSTSTEEARNQVWQELLVSPSLHADATNARMNGKSRYVFVTANDKGVIYQVREHKGIEALKGTPLEDYMMVLVHDHDLSFYHYGGQHQECLSHVLRYLQDSIENESSLTWNVRMKELIQKMIHETKQSRADCTKTIGEEKISGFEKLYDTILELASEEYKKNPPTKYYRDGFNLAKRMKKYRDEHLLFLHEENVDYTNNLAERLLRQLKRKMKQVGTFRSHENLEYFCNMLSIIQTTKMNSGSVYQKMVEAFQ